MPKDTLSRDLEERRVLSDIRVSGVCCDAKVAQVRSSLAGVRGVLSLLWNDKARTLTVEHDSGIVSCKSLVQGLGNHKVRARTIRDGAAQQSVAASNKSGLQTTLIRVNGLCCASEARVVDAVLCPLAGVATVRTNVVMKTVQVKHDPALTSSDAIVQVINDQGLGAVALRKARVTEADTSKVGPAKSRSADNSSPQDALDEAHQSDASAQLKTHKWPSPTVMLAAVFWVVSLFHYIESPPWVENLKYVALGSVALCLPPIAWRAVLRLRKLQLDINILMSLAVIGAVGLGEIPEAAAVVTLFSLSDWLESRATHSIRAAINEMLALRPETAVLAGGNDALEAQGKFAGDIIAADKVPVGTRLAVREGQAFPLDGTLVQGDTFADESALTGESRPVRKDLGSAVSAGTINVGGYVEMETTTAHEDSSVSRMIRLIEEANAARAPSQQLIERVAQIYTPLIFVAALLMATVPWAWGPEKGREYAKTALVLLVVACPCALVISTPITYVCGLAHAARKGIMIKGGRHLESLAHLSTLCVDKTGTLTQGRFELRELVDLGPNDGARTVGDEFWDMVYAAERGSPHPLATALCEGAQPRLLADGAAFHVLESVEIIPGQGIRATFERRPESCHCSEKAEARAGEVASEVASEAAASGPDESETTMVDLLIGNSALAAANGWTAGFPAIAEQVAAWEAEGATAGWIGLGGVPRAIYSVGDTLRPEAKQAVQQLGDLGIEVVMLTGDNAGSAQCVARQVGVSVMFAGLLPSDKVEHVRSIKAKAPRKVVGMVGDGVNDAPSFAAADVSVSLGCIGSPAALEAADVALMQDDLLMLVKAVRLGRLCFRKIVQNVAFSILSKVAVLVITLTVFPSLWLAILVDVGGMLIVTTNSLTVL